MRKTVLCRDQRSGTKPHGADRAGAGKAKRCDRKAESRKPDGMSTAEECLQGTGRRNCENEIDLRLSEEVRAEKLFGLFSSLVKVAVELFTGFMV